MYFGYYVMRPIHLSDFNQTWSFLTDYHKVSNIQFQKKKKKPASSSQVDTCRQTDRCTFIKPKRAFVTMQTCLINDRRSLVSVMMVIESRTPTAHKKIQTDSYLQCVATKRDRK
jgi:hypothetical protein